MNKKRKFINVVFLVIFFIVVGCVVLVYMQQQEELSKKKIKNDLNLDDVQEIGEGVKNQKEIINKLKSYPIGASVPSICFASKTKVYLYDYFGIIIYDLEKQQIESLVEFSEINEQLQQLEGESPTIVETANNGNTIYFYKENSSQKYEYNVSLNKVKKVKDIGVQMWIDEKKNVSVSFSKPEQPTYIDLQIHIKQDENDKIYKLISNIYDK